MKISDHIEDIMRSIRDEKLPKNTEKGLKSIIKKTGKEEWNCMEDFLGNLFTGLQQNIYNLETYAIDNEENKYDNINESIAKAICSILMAKNMFSDAKKNN